MNSQFPPCAVSAAFLALLAKAEGAAPIQPINATSHWVAMVAAVVDYGLVPKRFTPGWEDPLPIRSIAGGFAGLALGLAGCTARKPERLRRSM